MSSIPNIDGLESICAYIDSSIFIGKNYQYNHPAFVALKEQVANGRIRLILTHITLNEVKSHKALDLERALQEVKKIRAKVKVLRNHPTQFSVLFEDHDLPTLQKTLEDQFQVFLDDTKAHIISPSEANTDLIFDLYFNKKLPFGPGKKKQEFPDAFILSALNEWATTSLGEHESIYVISGDSDMDLPNEAFPRLVTANSLESFVDYVSTHFETLAPLAKELVEQNTQQIQELIVPQFESLGFIIDDQDGEVSDVSVDSIEEFENYLLSITPGDNANTPNEAKFELITSIKFTANLIYDDLETAMYDSEDKCLIPWQTVTQEITPSESIRIELAFQFNTQEPYNFNITKCAIVDTIDVTVSSREEW